MFLDKQLELLIKDGWNYHNQGQLDKAEQIYQQVLQSSEHPETLHLLGILKFQQQQFKASYQYIGQAIKLMPERPDFYLSLSHTLHSMGQTQRAIQNLQYALELKPDFDQAYNNLGNLFRSNGQWEIASGHYQEALRINPQSIESYNNLGEVLRQQGKNKAAIEYFQQGIALSPRTAELHFNMGLALNNLGQLKEAKKSLEHAVKLAPQKQHYLRTLQELGHPGPNHRLVEHILNTRVVAIFAWGSSGSVFLQSLLDNHPQILMFPATFIMNFHSQIWPRLENIFMQQNNALERAIEQFCKELYLSFDAQQDTSDYKLNQLGENQNQFIAVEVQRFKAHCIEIATLFQNHNIPLNRANFFLMVHYAYSLAREQDILEKQLLIYPLHNLDKVEDVGLVLSDFPRFKSIVCCRNPFKSLSSNLRMTRTLKQAQGKTYTLEETVPEGLFHRFYLIQLVGFENIASKFDLPTYYQPLESLHHQPKETLLNLMKWLQIDWSDTLLNSTFNGLKYWGNRSMKEPLSDFSSNYHARDKEWKQQLNALDRYVLGGLLAAYIEEYSYGQTSWLQQKLIPFLILIPTKLERQALIKHKESIRSSWIHYLDRINTSYKYLWNYPLKLNFKTPSSFTLRDD